MNRICDILYNIVHFCGKYAMIEKGDTMADLITLDFYNAQDRNYYVYKTTSSAVDGKAHYHNYYQVCYVACGELVHCMEDRRISLVAGDAFIIPPGTVHSLHFNNLQTVVYSMAFAESLFYPHYSKTKAIHFLKSLQEHQKVSEKALLRHRVALDKDNRAIMEKLLDSLMLQQKISCLEELSAASSMTESIIYLLAQNYYSWPQNSTQLDDLNSYTSAMSQCKAYIDRHFKENLTLQDLSKKFGFSRSAFSAVFPQIAGMPLKKYIAQMRIREAQMLIRSHKQWSLDRIAAEVGYTDASTFYRNFLRVTGVTPSYYRQICNGE